MSKSRKKDKSPSFRVRFSTEEAKFPWLSMLLDAYAIIDRGIAVAIDTEGKRRKEKLACKKGCDNCCRTHKDIPVYPLELVGIYWFSSEQTAGPLREVLRRQLSGPSEGCPFLTDGSCSIHPLRPAACRQFNVFNKSCAEGEDPYFTRRDDVLTPIQGYTNRAFSVTLAFYGITESADETQAVRSIIQTQAVNLRTHDWKRLVTIMDNFDLRKREDSTPGA